MMNLIKRNWQTGNQHFQATFNLSKGDFAGKVWASRDGFDCPLEWDELTLEEQQEIEKKFQDVA